MNQILRLAGVVTATLCLSWTCSTLAGEIAEGDFDNFLMSPEMKADANQSPYLSDAARCGHTCQAKNTPDITGTPMCGRSVRQMIECMSKSLVPDSSKCNARCGNGNGFIDCKQGNLDGCGYEKVASFLDKRCSLPGAILSYKKGTSTVGQTAGHVEFICGVSEYCSVYMKVQNEHSPRQTPDACWYPKQKNSAFGSGS